MLYGLIALIAFGILIIIYSALDISPEIGVLTIVGVIVYLLIYLFFLYPHTHGKRDLLQTYLNLQFMFAIFTFVQVIFWMLQPTNPYHEPKSVFFGIVSAFLAYMKNGYREFQKRSERDKEVSQASVEASTEKTEKQFKDTYHAQ